MVPLTEPVPVPAVEMVRVKLAPLVNWKAPACQPPVDGLALPLMSEQREARLPEQSEVRFAVPAPPEKVTVLLLLSVGEMAFV